MARPLKPRTPLGERLIALREKLGHTKREEFAARLGLSADTLGTYERGVAAPSLDLLAAYRKEFTVNLNWLICGEGEMLEVDPAGLSGDEAELVLKFRQLPPIRQELVLDTVDSNLERSKSE